MAAPTAVSSNPYLDQANQLSSGWAGDPYAAYSAQNSTAAAALQNQQQQILGNGGVGYIANGGNDQSGSSFGNARYNATHSPWASINPGNANSQNGQNTGGAVDPSNPLTALQNPNATNLVGYNGATLLPGQSTPYLTQVQENANIAANQASGINGYYEGQQWVNTPTPSSSTPGLTGTVATPASSTYPTYSNSYGLGTQSGNSAASTAAPAVAAPTTTSMSAFSAPSTPSLGQGNSAVSAPQGTSSPITATTGFNPWSLSGEANSIKP